MQNSNSPMEKKYITDEQWDVLLQAVSANKEEIDRLFVTFYLLLSDKIDGIAANAINRDESYDEPAQNIDYYLEQWKNRRNVDRIVHIAGLLVYLNDHLLKRRLSHDDFPFYKQIKPVPLTEKIVSYHGRYSIIPTPFTPDEPKYGLKKESILWLKKSVKLNHMVLESKLRRTIEIECNCIQKLVHPVAKNAMGLSAFETFEGVDQLSAIRILAASPDLFCIPTAKETGDNFFCETIWCETSSPNGKHEAQCVNQFAIESKKIIDICVLKKIDILILPEMMVTKRVLESFKDVLNLRQNEGDKQYPWLTVAGSSHCLENNERFNISCILDPFGDILWKQRKTSPFYNKKEPYKGFEAISSGRKMKIMDVPSIGRFVVAICKDYIDLGSNIQECAWVTHFLVPAFSEKLTHFDHKGMDLMYEWYASSTVSNHWGVHPSSENAPDPESIRRCMAISARKQYGDGNDKKDAFSPIFKRLTEGGSLQFWKNLWFIEL